MAEVSISRVTPIEFINEYDLYFCARPEQCFDRHFTLWTLSCRITYKAR
jgi:hypothetical protein